MPRFTILRNVPVEKTPRVLQMWGIFDCPPNERLEQTWEGNLPIEERDWNLGLIVGPSGSGKTTLARELFGENIIDHFEWSEKRSLLDDFPSAMSIKEITALLSSVGFSSPPSWVKPFHVLSTGEKFRVFVARVLAESREFAVIDEFTSVVDRVVAQIGSCAVARAVRSRNQKLIAVSCHYDIIDWLCPDWIFQPHTNQFAWGSQRPRPPIQLQIQRVYPSAWELFRPYHYLSGNLHKAAKCFVAFWDNIPVAFASALPMPHGTAKNLWREHRTVCLPDYQGVGIGNAISEFVAGLFKAMGKRYTSVTSAPAMIRHRNQSENWRMIRAPAPMHAQRGTMSNLKQWRVSTSRITASFEYVGKPADAMLARRLLS